MFLIIRLTYEDFKLYLIDEKSRNELKSRKALREVKVNFQNRFNESSDIVTKN